MSRAANRTSFPHGLPRHLLAVCCLATWAPDTAAAANLTDGPLTTDFSLAGTVQGVAGSGGFWGLAETFAPSAGFPDHHLWLEAFLRPGLRSDLRISESFTLHGGLAAIASTTLGKDYFLTGSTGRILMEDAFLGASWKHGENSFSLSAGQQPFTLGHALLLGVGAGNGFERGAAATFPRRSWEMTALARAASAHWSVDAFYLDAHELSSADTGTRLAGTSIGWQQNESLQAGLAWFKVTDSTSPYPMAPLAIIENGRNGLESSDLHWKWAPENGPLSGFSFLGETAIQRQPEISLKAFGAALELGYRWAHAPGAPRLSYSPRYFSGDNPATPDRLERFDPLFFDGGPATWSSGSNSSFAFYNSNLWCHRLRLELTIDNRNYLNINYWYTQADRTGSPLQFGQAARLSNAGGSPAIVTGVPAPSLSHDFWLEHTHLFSPQWSLTWGIAASFPGSGIRSIAAQPGNWWGALLNVSFRY